MNAESMSLNPLVTFGCSRRSSRMNLSCCTVITIVVSDMLFLATSLIDYSGVTANANNMFVFLRALSSTFRSKISYDIA